MVIGAISKSLKKSSGTSFRKLFKIKSAFLALTYLAFATGCGDSSAPTPQSAGSKSADKSKGVSNVAAHTPAQKSADSKTPTTDTVADLTSVLEKKFKLESTQKQLSVRDQDEEKELFVLQKVNFKLCERLQKLRSECAVAQRLFTDGNQKVLACVSNIVNPTEAPVVFQVTVSGAAGSQLKLEAENSYETNAFTDGTTALTWKTQFNTDVASPRLMEVTNLKVRAVSGPLPPLASLSISLIVAGQPVLNKTELAASSEAGTHSFKTTPFLTLRRAENCRVTNEEISKTKETARKEADAEFLTKAPSAENVQPVSEMKLTGENRISTQGNVTFGMVFNSIFGRLPLLDQENLEKDPFSALVPLFERNQVFEASQKLLSLPNAPQRDREEEIFWAVLRSHLVLTGQAPSEADLKPLLIQAQREAGLAQLIAKLTQSDAFKSILNAQMAVRGASL